jgi:drug/metabolite transporter (DMT)-like permease
MILFAGLFGLLIWGEIPDAFSLLGGLLIICGGVAVFLRTRNDRSGVQV